MRRYGLRFNWLMYRHGARYRVRRWPFFPPGAQAALLAWYGQNRRPFSWREAGVSPWGRLVAEMLLRKTAARHVEKVWPTLVDRCPTPAAMAAAEPAEVEGIVRPLGFGRMRSIALVEAARHIVQHHDGEVPAGEAELLAIPHVGPYTAYAVQAFAFGIPAPRLGTPSAPGRIHLAGRWSG